MTTLQKGRIFISYRRADSAGYAGRIYDRLSAHFGENAVFMDVDTIEAGLDFIEVLRNAVQSCDVLVALIGRRWLDSKDEAGQRRLDNSEDFVRIEVSTALSRDIRVIPVLVDGAHMPRSIELPDNLKALARRNALQVNHTSFNVDAQRLITQLDLALSAAELSKVDKLHLEIEEKEEQARKEKEVRERAAAEERARLASEQEDRKEREERARKGKEEFEKRNPPVIPVSPNYFPEPGKPTQKLAWLFFGIGGIVILACVMLFGIGYFIKNALAPSAAESPLTETPTVFSQTSDTAEPEGTPTNTLEELGVGSTMISEKDGMTMVYVPAGKFKMGGDADKAMAECQKFRNDCQRDWFSDEEPIHVIDLDAYWIDQTEVTNAMYIRCVGAKECKPPNSSESYTRVVYYGNSEFNDYPVIYVSWNDANAYCEWAGRRLPTEAEWEKAAGWDAGAQAQRMYPWGNTFDGTKVNFCDANCTSDLKNTDYNDGYQDTAPGGNYPNGVSYYGAYDMAGNVWEWVADWYDVYPGGNKNGSSNFGQTYRVIRGDSWFNYYGGSALRSTIRSSDDPLYASSDLGFRCARDAD